MIRIGFPLDGKDRAYILLKAIKSKYHKITNGKESKELPENTGANRITELLTPFRKDNEISLEFTLKGDEEIKNIENITPKTLPYNGHSDELAVALAYASYNTQEKEKEKDTIILISCSVYQSDNNKELKNIKIKSVSDDSKIENSQKSLYNKFNSTLLASEKNGAILILHEKDSNILKNYLNEKKILDEKVEFKKLKEIKAVRELKLNKNKVIIVSVKSDDIINLCKKLDINSDLFKFTSKEKIDKKINVILILLLILLLLVIIDKYNINKINEEQNNKITNIHLKEKDNIIDKLSYIIDNNTFLFSLIKRNSKKIEFNSIILKYRENKFIKYKNRKRTKTTIKRSEITKYLLNEIYKNKIIKLSIKKLKGILIWKKLKLKLQKEIKFLSPFYIENNKDSKIEIYNIKLKYNSHNKKFSIKCNIDMFLYFDIDREDNKIKKVLIDKGIKLVKGIIIKNGEYILEVDLLREQIDKEEIKVNKNFFIKKFLKKFKDKSLYIIIEKNIKKRY